MHSSRSCFVASVAAASAGAGPAIGLSLDAASSELACGANRSRCSMSDFGYLPERYGLAGIRNSTQPIYALVLCFDHIDE